MYIHYLEFLSIVEYIWNTLIKILFIYLFIKKIKPLNRIPNMSESHIDAYLIFLKEQIISRKYSKSIQFSEQHFNQSVKSYF